MPEASMPHLSGVLLLSLLLILPAWTVAETSNPVAEVSGSALLRQAEDLEKEVAQVIQTFMEQGFTMEIGQLKATPDPHSDFLDLIVPITVSKSAVFDATLSALAKQLDGTADLNRMIVYRLQVRDLTSAAIPMEGADPANLLTVNRGTALREHVFESLTGYRLMLELYFSDAQTPWTCEVYRSPVAVAEGRLVDAKTGKWVQQPSKDLNDTEVFLGGWDRHGPEEVKEVDDDTLKDLAKSFRLLGIDPKFTQLPIEEQKRNWKGIADVFARAYRKTVAVIFFAGRHQNLYDGKEHVRITKTLANKLEKILVKFRSKNIAAASERGDAQWCSAGLK
jgi:hypothetical protein